MNQRAEHDQRESCSIKSCFNTTMIVLMAGLPGTGKTTLAHALAAQTGGRVLSKDEIRHALFAPDEIEYSSIEDDFGVQIMLETADSLLQKNSKRILFLDGRTFSRRYQIENVVNAADSLHQSWRIQSAHARKKSQNGVCGNNLHQGSIPPGIAIPNSIWK